MFTKDLSDEDLFVFLELFRSLATAKRSRFFLDLLCIVEREAMARHQSTEMKDYSDDELVEACEELAGIVDAMREEGKTDAPDLCFIRLALTSAIAESEGGGLNGRRR